MTRPAIASIAPFSAVRDIAQAVDFYHDKLDLELKDADGYVLLFGQPR